MYRETSEPNPNFSDIPEGIETLLLQIKELVPSQSDAINELATAAKHNTLMFNQGHEDYTNHHTLDFPDLEILLSKYLEIIKNPQKIENFLSENFNIETSFSSGLVKDIQDNLQQRALEYITSFKDSVYSNINTELDKMHVDFETLGISFRSLAKEQGPSPENLEKLLLSIKHGHQINMKAGDIPESLRHKFKAVNSNSRRPTSTKRQSGAINRDINEALRDDSKSEFSFFIVDSNWKEGEEINPDSFVAGVRFDPTEDANTLYAGSLNVNPIFKKTKIGTAFLLKSLRDHAQNKKIEAVVATEKQDLLEHYLRLGFKATENIENFHNTGEPYARLEWEGKN